MTAQWYDLDIKYDHILEAIDTASTKVEKGRFKFVKARLDTAKEVQDGIAELKLGDPIQFKKRLKKKDARTSVF
ncbi:hypothetical protein PVK73_28380 [Bacillus thuringiensis]